MLRPLSRLHRELAARPAPVQRGAMLGRCPDLCFSSNSGQSSDRKSTRLNSSHANISYAVFCLKKKKKNKNRHIFNTRKKTALPTPHHHTPHAHIHSRPPRSHTTPHTTPPPTSPTQSHLYASPF